MHVMSSHRLKQKEAFRERRVLKISRVGCLLLLLLLLDPFSAILSWRSSVFGRVLFGCMEASV